VPEFTFPGSVCLGDSASTHSPGNRLAQVREWHLTGPAGVDSVLRDSFEFRYRFQQAGEYVLRQSVWVLGCRYEYERAVTVLPPLDAWIGADSLICPGEPHQISAQASRPAVFTWNTGAVGAVLPLSESGTYSVTADDGACEAGDTAAVQVVAGLLGGGEAVLRLPPDTTVCDKNLPFLLEPESDFSAAFYLGNSPGPATVFPLAEAGTYGVSTTAFGCVFSKTFTLRVDCEADVYVPNTFSPNGDGINDVFKPFGKDFRVLELSVYDRWGRREWRGEAWWDGGEASPGVYVYRLTYLDLLTGKKVMRTGDVVLVR
jgi:hypothetical protein